MKFIKLIINFLLIAGLLLLFSSCFSSGIQIDEDGNVKIKGEDGDIEIGKTEWDGQKMYGLSSPDAKLDSYINVNDSFMYTFSEMKEDDAKKYIEKIKEAGFTYSTVIMNDYSFTGTNKDGKTVSFTYDKESRGGTIIAAQGEKPSEEDNGEEAVFGSTDKKWDSSKMGGLPDPGTKITAYWSLDGDTCYTFEALADYEDYLEEIKACGFTVNPSQAEINDTFMYSASNSDGDSVSFTSSKEAGSVTFDKNE
jgi:hypothetical protein